MKTKVVFLVHEDNTGLDWGPDLFAFFPDEPYDKEHTPDLYTCYQHAGQHSACHIEYANESKSATWQEYKDLFFELLNIGYDLEVIDMQGNKL